MKKDKYYLSTLGAKNNSIYYAVISVFGEPLIVSTSKREEAVIYYEDDAYQAIRYLKRKGIIVHATMK